MISWCQMGTFLHKLKDNSSINSTRERESLMQDGTWRSISFSLRDFSTFFFLMTTAIHKLKEHAVYFTWDWTHLNSNCFSILTGIQIQQGHLIKLHYNKSLGRQQREIKSMSVPLLYRNTKICKQFLGDIMISIKFE